MKRVVVILLIIILVVGFSIAADTKQVKPVKKIGKNAYVDGICVSETKDGKKADMDVYGTKISNNGKKAVFYTWSTNLNDHRNGPKVFIKNLETETLECRGNGLTPGISNNGQYLVFESVPTNVKTQRPYIVLQDLTTGDMKLIEYTSRLGYWMPNKITWADDDSYFTFYSYSEKYSNDKKPALLKYYVSGILKGVLIEL